MLVTQLSCCVAAVTLTLTAQDTDQAQKTQGIGLSASEVIRGNGTRAGYVLGHGNVVSGSETVYVGVRRVKRQTDYTIDYSSGNLFFAEPVPVSESVRVDYSYDANAKSERPVTGPGALLLKFGSHAQANLTYSYRTADADKGEDRPDILTYGVNTTSKIGNSSSISSMLYVATPQASNRVSLKPGAATPKSSANTVKKDELMVHSADIGIGALRLTAGYQSVGEGFAGFEAMRESGAAKTDVLSQLEKEKGLKRLDLGSQIGLGATGKLSFSRGSIEDKEGDITTQYLAYSGDRIQVGFSSREVDKTFTRFKDLKEGDRAQIANEAGLTRSQQFLKFKTSGAKGSTDGWSSFVNTTLSGENGELAYKAASVDLGNVRIEADIRSASPEFTEMKAINDEERTRMALVARQQFDPLAKASAVAAADKAQVDKEAGLDRESYRAQYGVGPLWLSLSKSNLSSAEGGLSRSDFHVQHKMFKLHLGRHRIDETFTRLSSMQATELKHYGNEHGMTRTDLDGEFKLPFGSFDLTHKHVTDQNGAKVNRDKLSFKTKGVEVLANLQSIDPQFSRLADLSDSDKGVLARDLGFKRSDYSLNLTAVKNLKVKSYIYDSTNTTAEQTRNQRKHEVAYDGPKGLKFTGLSDDFSYYSDDGNISSYSRRKYSFDNSFNVLGGLRVTAMRDANMSQKDDEAPVITEVTQTHLETKATGSTAYTFDSMQIHTGNGTFENMWALGVKAKAAKRLAFVGSYSRTDRNIDPESNGTLGVDWSVNNDLKMSFNIANRDGGPKGSQQSHQFSLSGTLAKNALGLFQDVKIGSAVNTTQLAGKQTACDNGLKLQGKFIGGEFLLDNTDKLNPKNGLYYSSRLIKYDTDKASKKWYQLSLSRQSLVTPTNELAEKHNYALNLKLNSHLSAKATSYFGKDGQNGSVLPVGGGVFKLTYACNAKTSFFADYSDDVNESTKRRAKTAGIGFAGTLSNGSSAELYLGLTHLTEKTATDADTVFRVKYDHKMDPAHFITLAAEKKSAVHKSKINPNEGNFTASIDFKTVFN